MTSQTSDFFTDLESRGIAKQVTDNGLPAALRQGPVTLYCGFDPTSDSLHVGSLFPLLTLRRFQLAGHRPIAVVGGATGMIGDPSGKSAERTLLTSDVLKTNVEGITRVVERFLDRSGSHAARIVDNADWFKGVSYIDFLRDVGKHFTVNHMVAKESVRARLEDREHGISYTEFSYMLLQAYDFFVLHRDFGCNLQVGGSDQWGNITAGIELIRRMSALEAGGEASVRALPAVFGMTHPLVLKADGTKFGKTEQGTIWLDPARTSPYAFYQFWIQSTDADVGNYLRFFSFESASRLDELLDSLAREPEKREAQKALAREMTDLVHGRAERDRAEKAAQALFGEEIRELDARTLREALAGAPSIRIARTRLESPEGLPLVDALVESGLAASKGAARKDIQGGGVYVNNERVSDVAAALTARHLIAEGTSIVLRKGKKSYSLIQLS